MSECKFKIGDFVKTGHIRGIVREISLVNVKSNTLWVVDLDITYFYSSVDKKDISSQHKILTFKEKDLEFDRSGRLDDLLK